MKFILDKKEQLGYEDVFIQPQYSDVLSRKEVATSVNFLGLALNVPMMSANMVSVTEEQTCIEMYHGGGIGALHRFMSIEENVKVYRAIKKTQAECFVSIGVNEESKERLASLYEAGARYVIIDIAHGHHVLMKNMITYVRDTYGDSIKIVAGNVTTSDAVHDLAAWGADAVKVGIANGFSCRTKNVTGVSFPQFSAVEQCSHYGNFLDIPIIADGGCSEIGDVCKAIGAGATMVMSGKFFSTCIEAPGTMDALLKGKQKSYFGSASVETMKLHKDKDNMPVAEGASIDLEPTERSVKDVLKDIRDGLASSMSYSGSRNIVEFQENVLIGIKKK